MSLLEVKDLKTYFYTDAGCAKAVDGVSFSLDKGKVLGIVGESGCGKSVTSLSIMGLVDPVTGRHEGGEILFHGEDLSKLSEKEKRKIRGNKISMIFQEPMTSLNPVFTVGYQIEEALMLHLGMDKNAARQRAVELLKLVEIPEAEKRVDEYPHQLSGGMRQRVMIAMALSCNPELLIADEPTTALDVTVQAQIMTLLNELKREFNTAIIMITHDLGVVAGICDKVLVMYAGRTMEYGEARDVFYQPSHPYSIGLLNAVPRLDAEGDALLTIPGNPPNLLRLPKGCPFQPRCPHAMEICNSAPPLEEFAPGRLRACFQPVGDLL